MPRLDGGVHQRERLVLAQALPEQLGRRADAAEVRRTRARPAERSAPERPSGGRSIGSVALINASLTAAPRALATVASMPVLEARGIVKTLGAGRAERRILDGVDLDVDAGEVVAVLGRSGSGKSTLLHLLGGLDRPDAGQIVLAGHDITSRARARWPTRLRHVGFVFQSFHLIEELSGEENVLLPARLPGARRGRGAPRPAADRRARADRDRRPASARAVGRRAAAPGDRPGAGQRPRAGAGRRADREPRPGERRHRAGAAAQPPPAARW